MVPDPHKTIIPQTMVDEVVAWFAPRVTPLTCPPPSPPSSSRPPPTQATISVPEGDAIATVVTEPVFLDEARTLFAMKTSPVTGVPSGQAVLFLNAGAVHNIGPNRLYVTLGRHWAARGHLVLRLDNAGIGESKPRPGAPENVVYADRALDDAEAALRYLKRQPGITRVDVIGLCSGAYHGFKAAVAGLPVDNVIAINPLTFFWNPSLSLDYPKHKVAAEARRYGESARSLKSWKKLLRGDVRLRVVAKVFGHRALDVARHEMRDVARRLHIPFAEDLGSELDKIASQRIGLCFVFAEGDPGIVLLSEGGGAVVPRLVRNRRISIASIDGPDHTFTPVWSHAALAEILERYIAAPLETRR